MINKDKWLIFNAENKILGRFASKIVTYLIGKNNPYYTQNKVMGNQIIIINSKKIKVTGEKIINKIYYKHSGYPGGIKSINLKTMFKKNPNFILKNAIRGMLPKNKLQKIFLKRLRIYPGLTHPHIAQKPISIKI